MLLPGDKDYPRGYKRAKARLRYHHMKDKTTLSARAALGRMLYHDHATPSSEGAETIGWNRESGMCGYMNRTQRKKRTV